MTTFESFMLSICFGAVVGSLIGNVVCIIKWTIDEHKEKKRQRAREAEVRDEH